MGGRLLERRCAARLRRLWLTHGGIRARRSDAADRFVAAVGSSDARQACALLAPRTVEQVESTRHEGCEQALPSLGLPSDVVTEVQVWGDAAQARTAGDVLFLRELDTGWRVVAAGCRPPQDQSGPYQCELEGS